MNSDLQTWIVVGGTFVFVTSIIMIFGSHRLRRERIRSRLAVGTVAASDLPSGSASKIISRIDDKLVGLDSDEKAKLRYELLRAGYFSLDAPKIFTVIRALMLIALPLGGYILASLFVTNLSPSMLWLLIGCLAYVGYALPDAFVKRRKARMLETYRRTFPDFLDLLLVCVDAGLSFDAALVRVGREFATRSPEFATNLAILSGEMRSGRSTTEALDNLSNRLGLDEARSFCTLLKQSLELGSDIGNALRTYADEMRDKRMSRAEAAANAVPVKMSFPIAVFIFPVLLMVLLTPVVINAVHTFKSFGGK
jgi:tight adherence protein C